MKNDTRKKKGKHVRRRKKSIMPLVLAAVFVTVIALAVLFVPEILDKVNARGSQHDLRQMYYGEDVEPNSGWLTEKHEGERPEQGTVAVTAEPEPTVEEVVSTADPVAETVGELDATAEPEITPLPIRQRHSDFDELYAQNQHIVGWLKLGARIDYPVVQHDNSYYLDHDFYGNYEDDGTIFVNQMNTMDPVDPVLLIHGHNMKSGAMFGDLDLYREYEHLCEYPIVTFRSIYDETDVYYVPISAFDASMVPGAFEYFDITRINFEYDVPAEENGGKAASTELDAYISELRAVSYWNSPVEADSTDQYIILVTCSYFHEDGRMMLVCRKLRDGETPESVSALFEMAE